MTHPAQATPPVEVMWRPGCRFCSRLRRGLSRAGVVSVEYNIRSCVDAAARMRAATGGNETVPTVFVGPRALVNPTVDQVVAALKSVDPSYAPTHAGTGVPPAGPGLRSGHPPGLIWTLAVAVVWVLLVLWRPTTTWHLAPPLMAAAWPWVAGQDLCRSDPKARRALLTASAGALAASVGLTAALGSAGRLDGPTWTGAATPGVEALALAGAATLLATLAGL